MVQDVDHGLHDDVDGRKLPHFLGVGAQKAGTTWLWNNLVLHPDIWLPPRKEIHFLDRHWDKGYTWYLRHFGPRRVAGRIAGEITPNYLVAEPERIATMGRINPDMRIVILVREPLDRAWSAARYYAKNRTNRHVEELSLDEFRDLVHAPTMAARGDYKSGIERWSAVFGTDQLLVKFTDEIVSDPVATFESVADFLGCTSAIDPDAYPLRTVFNAGPKTEMPEQHRRILEALVQPQREWLAGQYGDRGIGWMQ